MGETLCKYILQNTLKPGERCDNVENDLEGPGGSRKSCWESVVKVKVGDGGGFDKDCGRTDKGRHRKLGDP